MSLPTSAVSANAACRLASSLASTGCQCATPDSFQVGEFADVFARGANAISGLELAFILESLEICNHALDSDVADHGTAELVLEAADKPALANRAIDTTPLW